MARWGSQGSPSTQCPPPVWGRGNCACLCHVQLPRVPAVPRRRLRLTDAALPSPVRDRAAFYRDPRLLRRALPAVSLAVILIAIFLINDRAMSYRGLDLMLKYAIPIAFATIAQTFILTVNDLDLSTGAFVGLVACIAGLWLVDQPLVCLLLLAACIAAYA